MPADSVSREEIYFSYSTEHRPPGSVADNASVLFVHEMFRVHEKGGGHCGRALLFAALGENARSDGVMGRLRWRVLKRAGRLDGVEF
jgi:hypothetical protein